MFRIFKRKGSAEAANNLEKAASVSSVDRRAHVRVTYPQTFELESLPKVRFQGKDILPGNVSLGGMLLRMNKVKGLETGKEYEFQFYWKEKPEGVMQRAILLRVSHSNYHFKFVDLATDLIVKCSLVFKAGERGRKAQRLAPFDLPKERQDVVEMWSNGYGDYVAVTRALHSPVEIQYLNKKYVAEKSKMFQLKSADGGQPVTRYVLEDVLLFLCNIPNISETVAQVVQGLAGTASKSA